MTYFSAIPVPETTVGIALETERGVPVEPTAWVPVMGPQYKPDLMLLPDEGLRGSMVTLYDEVPGLRFDGHGWDQYPYLDTFPNVIRALLGSSDNKTAAPSSTVLVAEAAAAATHVMTEASIAEGSYIVIGTVGVAGTETHLTKKVTEIGAKEFEVELAYPLAFKHAAAATVTGLTKHAFSLLNNSPATGNQPPSYTITDFGGETSWRQLPAAQLDSLILSGGADILPKAALNWFANKSITPSAPSPSFSTVEAPPGWTAVASIGGSQISYLVTWEFTLKRNVKNVPAITGTQNYYQHFASALEATAKLVVLENPAATWLTAYENGEQVAIDLTLYDVQNGLALNVHSTKAKFTSGALDRSKEWVEVPLDVQLIPSTTDALAGGVSPVLITVANKTSTDY